MITQGRVLTAKPAPTDEDWQRAGRRAIDEGIIVYRVENSRRYFATSSSSLGIGYELMLGDDGEVRCSCPGFEWRGICKHSAKLRLELGALVLPEDMS